MTSDRIRVAVVGGGIGGLCTAIGLLKLPHIDVQVYEAAHKFSEIGAGVAFGPNAQRALGLIGPEVEAGYRRQETRNMWKELQNTWAEYYYGTGARADQFITAVKNERGQSSVHRAKFLDELVALVPSAICHFGKRLDRVEDAAPGPVTLHFQDGTTAVADAVIGADGVHSIVRSHILGANHPAGTPTFTHSVAYRGLIPMDKAVEALGERFAQNTFIFVGKDGVVMIYPIDFGKTMNLVATNSTRDHWEGPWVQPANFANIARDFAGWGPMVQKIINLLDQPDTKAWSIWDLPPGPTYCKGRLGILGDAAHASTPFQGQGAGQAIEDALVLQHLFGRVASAEQIPWAFEAYDLIRRPRSQKVCETSREAGELSFLRLPSVMDDEAALKENVKWRMDWMWNRDVGLEREQAALVFDKLCRGEPLDPELS